MEQEKVVFNITRGEAKKLMDAGLDKEKAAAEWKELGDRHGFLWDTAEPVEGKDHHYFKAVRKPTT